MADIYHEFIGIFWGFRVDNQYGLVADIGGTNARFALAPLHDLATAVHLRDVVHVATLSVSAFATIDDAIMHYLNCLPDSIERPKHAVLAIACPTDQDTIQMTNTDWVFSVSAVRSNVGLDSLVFINDFYAVASAVPSFTPSETVAIGEGTPVANAPLVVTGAGTGLGLGALVFDAAGHPITIQGEGGHIHFAPLDDEEKYVFDYLRQKHHRVSVERLVSGQGIENIFEALHFKSNGVHLRLKAEKISENALVHQDPICVQALLMFCAIFGSFAGDAALMYGARGGVYLGGGILPRMIPFVKQSQFRARFMAKARLSTFVMPIPTYIITCTQPGLLGAAVVLRQKLAM